MPRIQGSQFFNGCYLYIDYRIGTQDYANNRTRIDWTIGVHNGNADIRYDNARATFTATGGTSGDATPGPVSTGWPTPAGQNQDQNLESGWFWAIHDSSGQCTVTVTGSVSSDFGSSSINTNFALPQIPQTPASPSAASASRVSDSQINVSWTNHSTGTAPYANIKVYRKVDGGGWALRATLGVVTSYSDTSVSANHRYQYRMSAVGVNGVEVGYATTGFVWTTPGAPTNCTATKLSNGNIQVTWTNKVNYSEYLIEIQESTDGGSSWSNLNTSIAAGTTSYTHTSPNPAVTHRYRVRAKTSQGSTLFSSYSSPSNTITLLATANPPTNLSPSGVALDATEDIVFRWQHNPADGTPQTFYRIQYRVDGGSVVTIGPIESSASSHTLPAGTLSNGHTITWWAYTAGANETLSPQSAVATFTTSARPTVAISSPSASHNSSSLTVTWVYFQEQGAAQATWVAELFDSTGRLLERISGTTETAGTFTTKVADGATYTVRVAVTSAAGLESEPAEQTFTVVYLPPAPVSLTASYDAPSGCMVLEVTGSPAEDGVTVPIATVDLQRSIDGGDWVTFAAGIVLDSVSLRAVVVDTAPTIRGSNSYRAVAQSGLPSSVTSPDVTVETTEKRWGFLSTGPGFATIARLRAAPTFSTETARRKAVHHFAGRELPVELSGESLTRVVYVQATLRDDSSTPAEFEAIAASQQIVLWRDPSGRRVFGSLGRLSTQSTNHRITSVSFDITEVDYSEGVTS